MVIELVIQLEAEAMVESAAPEVLIAEVKTEVGINETINCA